MNHTVQRTLHFSIEYDMVKGMIPYSAIQSTRKREGEGAGVETSVGYQWREHDSHDAHRVRTLQVSY